MPLKDDREARVCAQAVVERIGVSHQRVRVALHTRPLSPPERLLLVPSLRRARAKYTAGCVQFKRGMGLSSPIEEVDQHCSNIGCCSDRVPVDGAWQANMTFTSGTPLGRYKITSPLGAGGMGENLAQDTQLERVIALKICWLMLPMMQDGFADSPRRPKLPQHSITQTS